MPRIDKIKEEPYTSKERLKADSFIKPSGK